MMDSSFEPCLRGKMRAKRISTAILIIVCAIQGVLANEAPYRVGQWLPSDQNVLEQWLQDLIDETDAEKKSLLPVVEKFKNLIEGDPVIYMLFHQMFEEIPKKPPYNDDPTNKPQIRNWRHMLQLINTIMTKAPEFNKTGLPLATPTFLLNGKQIQPTSVADFSKVIDAALK